MIRYQELLPSGRLMEVYRANPTRGTAMTVDVLLCNQSPAHWVLLDVIVTQAARDPDDYSVEFGEQVITAPLEYYLRRGFDLPPTKSEPLALRLHAGEIVRVKASTATVACTVMAEELVTPDALRSLEERVDVLVEDVLRLQEAEENSGVTAMTAGTDAERAALRTDTSLRRYPLFDTEAELVNGTAAIESLPIPLGSATRVESLMLRASSIVGTSDVKAEYRTSWDASLWDHYDDFVDITSSTLLDRPSQPEVMNTYAINNAPVNRYIQFRITGVAANAADTLVAGYVIVREGYAR